VVQKAVHGSVGQEWVTERRRPLADIAVPGDVRCDLLVSMADDFVEAHGSSSRKPGKQRSSTMSRADVVKRAAFRPGTDLRGPVYFAQRSPSSRGA
jgi:hypothetical protein